MILLFYCVVFVVAVCVIRLGVNYRQHLFIDTPNHRSLHSAPIPRIGGLLLVPLFLLTAALLEVSPKVSVALTIAGLLVVGLWLLAVVDDACDLKALPRLIVQLSLCVGASVFFAQLAPSYWWCLWVIYAVSALNFYNFMDGADGLAALQGVVGFSACGVFASMLWPDSGLTQLALLIVVLLLAFLLFNWRPAKVFMGDAGSTVLGAGAALFAALFFLQSPKECWLAILPFLPFWLDAGFTLIKRIVCGEKFWQAHREHVYQRKILSGSSHQSMAISYALLSLLGSSVGFVYLLLAQ